MYRIAVGSGNINCSLHTGPPSNLAEITEHFDRSPPRLSESAHADFLPEAVSPSTHRRPVREYLYPGYQIHSNDLKLRALNFNFCSFCDFLRPYQD